ncbi:MAG: glycosyl transferase [Bacteroidia bacterium]|nr:MAG: glycosyl transferase [Bacteroidia bacterium]
MKIFIIGPAFPYRGGPARFNENFVSALLHHNISTEIISFTLQYPSLLFPGTSQFENTSQIPTFPFKIVRLISTINPFSWFHTARYINREKPDAIIFRYWLPFFAPAFGTIAKLLDKKIKILALTDNVEPHERRVGDKIFNQYFLSSCDGFITMSDKVLNDLNQYVPKKPKIKVFHPLYENYPPIIDKHQARQLLQLPVDKKILLFFGLIRSYKGLDILLNALKDINLQKEDFVLLIAGEFYDDKEKYLQIIRNLNLDSKIILHDYYIPDEKVNLYFSACDVVVQPYKSATNSGVSMVSYFYNKPIISTNVGGLREIILDKKTGWLCEPTSESLSLAIMNFLMETNLHEIEKNILSFKKEFSWNTFVEKIVKFTQDIKK